MYKGAWTVSYIVGHVWCCSYTWSEAGCFVYNHLRKESWAYLLNDNR